MPADAKGDANLRALAALRAEEDRCTLTRSLPVSMGAETLVCDYLVLGAGAMGMGFSDALVEANQEAEVIIVDNRTHPGGHWNDAYSFAHGFWYGHTSLQKDLATYESHATRQPHQGRPDGYAIGTTRGAQQFFENQMRAMVATGRVRYFPVCQLERKTGSDDRAVVRHLLTGKQWTVQYRKRFVDGTFSKVDIPLLHELPFATQPGVKCVPPHDLHRVYGKGVEPSGFVVIGAGRTGIDVITWLMRHGVPPARVKWVMPSNAWLYISPVYHKHLGHLGSLDRWAEEFGRAIQEVAATGGNALDVFRSLARRPAGAGHRVVTMNPEEPEAEIYRCCQASEEELRLMRMVPLVRKGYVKALMLETLELERGREPSFGPATIYVDCSARGQVGRDPIPVWQNRTIVPQPCVFCNVALSAAILGRLEGSFPSDSDEARKNALCRPIPPSHTLASVLIAYEAQHHAVLRWKDEPAMRDWLRRQVIFVDSFARYEQVSAEDTMGAMETVTTSAAIQAVLLAEAARTVDRSKLGAAPQALALHARAVAPLQAKAKL